MSRSRTTSRRAILAAGTLAVAGLIGAPLTGFAFVSDDQVNSADAVGAVAHVAPHAVSDLTPTTATTGGAVAALPGGSVSLPADPAHGIRIKPTDAAGVRIGLPYAGLADNAVHPRNARVTVYDNNNGSSTIPVVHSDGTVQITTVIAEPTAPTRYSYHLAIPDGATLRVADDGSVRSEGGPADAPQVSLATPWARDARGQRVPTHYEVNGRTLTQVVDFTSSTKLPIVADPVVSVNYTTSKVINVKTSTSKKWKYLNGCTAARNKSCSVGRSYSVSATVQTALNVSAKAVGGSLGITAGKTYTVQVTCGVPKGPGTVTLYAQATKKTYRIQTTRHYGVATGLPGSIKTSTKTSGTLTAYRPNGRYTCA